MGGVQQLNRFAGIAVGIYFAGVIVYLLNTAVVLITQAGEWRTVMDVIAVGCYLIGGLPLIYIALQELDLQNTWFRPYRRAAAWRRRSACAHRHCPQRGIPGRFAVSVQE